MIYNIIKTLSSINSFLNFILDNKFFKYFWLFNSIKIIKKIMNKKLCIIATSTQSISAFLEKYIDEFSKQNNSITLISNFSKNQKDYVNLEFLKKYKNLRKIHIPFNRKPNLILDIISLIKLIYIFRINSFDLFFQLLLKQVLSHLLLVFFLK